MSKNTPGPDAPPATEQVEFELSIEDTVSQQKRGLQVQGSKPAVIGYNPYDTKAAAAARAAGAEPKRKPTDLRKLSEWIRTQRQVEALKNEKPDPDSDPD